MEQIFFFCALCVCVFSKENWLSTTFWSNVSKGACQCFNHIIHHIIDGLRKFRIFRIFLGSINHFPMILFKLPMKKILTSQGENEKKLINLSWFSHHHGAREAVRHKQSKTTSRKRSLMLLKKIGGKSNSIRPLTKSYVDFLKF